ncbi:MAG: VOC family protein [Planctomycetaceae bacterium]
MHIRGLTTLLQVFDMPRSVAFYRDVLGFRVEMTSEPGVHYDWAMLKRGEIMLMLNTAFEADERPSSPDPQRAAAHADTVLYFLCSDADEAYAHLLARGCHADEPVTTDYGMRQVSTRDLDGYELCFQHPVGYPAETVSN